jgi:hypothetical protein
MIYFSGNNNNKQICKFCDHLEVLILKYLNIFCGGILSVQNVLRLWYVDPLLGSGLEISDYTRAVAR